MTAINRARTPEGRFARADQVDAVELVALPGLRVGYRVGGMVFAREDQAVAYARRRRDRAVRRVG